MASSSASAYNRSTTRKRSAEVAVSCLHSDSVAGIRLLPNSASGMLDSSLTVVQWIWVCLKRRKLPLSLTIKRRERTLVILRVLPR